jgi:hypothetical protein
MALTTAASGILIVFLLSLQLHSVCMYNVPCGDGDRACECPEGEDVCKFELRIRLDGERVKINDNFPGPTLIVRQGQLVSARVVNNLPMDYEITVHWHGMHQTDTPWMDGLGYTSQAPISPGTSFTYYFKPADPTPNGTHWYHSHVGRERTKGLFGALIVIPRENYFQNTILPMISDVHYPNFQDLPSEHTLTLLDDDSDPENLVNLINGHDRDTKMVFSVTRGKAYRFRVAGAQNRYAYKLSIDNQMLHVFASDGHFFRPEVVDALVVHSGERYDFIIHADSPGELFCIRATTPEIESEAGLAILNYDNTEIPERWTCPPPPPSASRSRVLNCLNSEAFENSRYDCVYLHNLKPLLPPTGEVPQLSSASKDVFFNFAFEGIRIENIPTPSVNGNNFIPPLTPPYSTADCDIAIAGSGRRCTKIHEIAVGRSYPEDGPAETVVMVLSSVFNGAISVSHPVHLHGHSFYVLHVGHGKPGVNSPDLNCTLDENNVCHGQMEGLPMQCRGVW